MNYVEEEQTKSRRENLSDIFLVGVKMSDYVTKELVGVKRCATAGKSDGK